MCLSGQHPQLVRYATHMHIMDEVVMLCTSSNVDTQAGVEYKAQTMHSIYLAAGTLSDWLVFMCPKAIKECLIPMRIHHGYMRSLESEKWWAKGRKKTGLGSMLHNILTVYFHILYLCCSSSQLPWSLSPSFLNSLLSWLSRMCSRVHYLSDTMSTTDIK